MWSYLNAKKQEEESKARKEREMAMAAKTPFGPYASSRSPAQLEMQDRWMRHKAMTRDSGRDSVVYGSKRSESARSKSKRSSKSKKSKRSRSQSASQSQQTIVIGQSNPTSMVI